MEFRKQLTSASIRLQVFADANKRGSHEVVEIDIQAVLDQAARDKLPIFEVLKRNIEFRCYQVGGNWEQAYALASQVAKALDMAKGNPALLAQFQDEKKGLDVALESKDVSPSPTKTKPPVEQTDASKKDQQLPVPGVGLTSQDVVAALATGKSLKSEAAFRQAFLALGKDPNSAKRFSQDLVAGLSHKPENGKTIMELLIGLRDAEAQGGSQELFGAYDQVIKALAKEGTELPAEEDGYSINYKGKQDFSGTPIEVARENKVHAAFVESANQHSVEKETSLSAEKDPIGKNELQQANLTGSLFDNGVAYDDVKQGGLGDCYFVASMSAVAQQRPDIIKNSISQEQKFPDGTPPPPGQRLFGVTFYRKGSDETLRPVKIYVTSSIATKEEGGIFGLFANKQAAFASASNSNDLDKAEIWPIIYEKAYAKFRGSYNDIGQGGQGDEALETITGMQSREINPKKTSDEQTYQFISTAMRNKFPVVASTIQSIGPKRADGRQEHDLEDGLVSGHVYTVLGVRREGSAIFVRVRNPWGKNGKHEGNGEQEVPIEKFKQYFNGLAVAG